MAATRALLQRGVRDLHLICVPTGGIQADILIGAGAVSTIETSAASLGEHGAAPRFVAAVRAGRVRILDATCPAIHAGLQASQKGVPFMPLRGLLGTDLVARRSEWKVIDNPFAPGDPIVVLPAIAPDVALFHAPCADRHGNVFIGRSRDLVTMAQAARATYVTVEEVFDGDLLADSDRAGSTIPAVYIARVAIAPNGCWPLGLPDRYVADDVAMARYATAAASAETFGIWLAEWLSIERR